MTTIDDFITNENLIIIESFVNNYDKYIYHTLQEALNNNDTIDNIKSKINKFKLEEKIKKLKLKLSKHKYDDNIMNLIEKITVCESEYDQADYNVLSKHKCIIDENEIFLMYNGDNEGYGDYLFSINDHEISTNEFSLKRYNKIKNYCSKKFNIENKEMLFKFLINVLDGDIYPYEAFQLCK